MASTSYDVPAARKTLRLLELLSISLRPLGIAEISRTLGLNTNMVYRLVTVLRDERWIIQEPDEPKYRLSAYPFDVLSRARYRMTLHEAAAEPMRKLWRLTGESVHLAILHENQSLFLAHLDGTQAIRIAGRVGGCYPLHCSAAGKVLLANCDEPTFNRIAKQGFVSFTGRTICTMKSLHTHLQKVREQGWALDNEEHGRGILCYAVPIFNQAQAVIAALGISVTTIGYTVQELLHKLAPHVHKAGQAISRQLDSPVLPPLEPAPSPNTAAKG